MTDCESKECCESGGSAPVSQYEITGFATFPNAKLRRRICSTCAEGHRRRGYTVVEVNDGAS